ISKYISGYILEEDSMNAQDCLQILREVKDVTFATTDENGRPRARIIDVMLEAEGSLYFCTARGRDFYRELPERRLCGDDRHGPGFPDGAPGGKGVEGAGAEKVDRPHF